MISRDLLEPHLRCLWWWQRNRVLRLVADCLNCLASDNSDQIYELIETVNGKPRQVLILCLIDCLQYVHFTSKQIHEALEGL